MTHITHVGPVFVPVSDQDAALDFYVNTLGFEQRVDFAYADGERWVEVGPPGVSTHLTLAQARASRPAGIETGIVLGTGDVEAAHAALRPRASTVGEIFREGDPVVEWAGAIQAGIPAMFLLSDPDGNSFLIVQI